MRRRLAIAGIGAVVLAALWFVVLAALGAAASRKEPARIAARLGESLQGSAAVAAVDVELVRGRMSIDRLTVRRDDAAGRLALDVPEVRCELAPLGVALVDRDCRELAVRGVRLEVSSLAVLHPQHPRRPPIRTDRLAIADATLAFAPNALLPAVGRVAVQIDRAVAGPTVLRTPLSWIFALEGLDATIELPAGLAVQLTFHAGQLGASGALFGDTPVVVPVELPRAPDDARDEPRALVELAKDVAERLVAARAASWLGR
jgi:hypothetical protein